MSESDDQLHLIPDVPANSTGPLVVRSSVPPGLPYREYKEFIRDDFYYSCAYCGMSEAEATTIRFTIDHYEPQSANPELENEYSNLMYCCDECNTRKGNRCPPPKARIDGYRFFRPDEDIRREHFELTGIRIEGVTNTGSYTIDSLDLNRQTLRRLRELRQRLTDCDRYVAEGVLALKHYRIDRLPPSVKGAAFRAIKQADDAGNQIANDIDKLLKSHAKAEIIDPDIEAEERARARSRRLRQLEVLYPGAWRHSREAN